MASWPKRGRADKSWSTRQKALCASAGFSPLGTRFTAASTSRLIADFAAGAVVLADAGFDAVELHMGHHFHAGVPFEESYFRPLTRQFRDALSMPLIALGGINTPASMQQAREDGFALVALGRALLREPDLVSELVDGTHDEALTLAPDAALP